MNAKYSRPLTAGMQTTEQPLKYTCTVHTIFLNETNWYLLDLSQQKS